MILTAVVPGHEMANYREKTLSYRRAEWLTPGVLTLERCIRDAHLKLQTIAERTIVYGAHHVRSAKMKSVTSGGILMHITAEIPGDSTSVVPKISDRSSEFDLGTARPPSGGEWLTGDAFLYVRDDHVCMCTTDIHDGAVRYFLQLLFEKSKLRKDSTRFSLEKVADISKVKLLHRQGVKELELRATLFKATASYAKRKNAVVGVTGAIGKHLKAVAGKPNDVTKDALRVELVLKVDRRLGQRNIAVGEKQIEFLAANVLQNRDKDDEFVIVTGTGERITRDEIFVRSKVRIESDGKTVNCDKAWEELLEFFGRLYDTGVLEQ